MYFGSINTAGWCVCFKSMYISRSSVYSKNMYTADGVHFRSVYTASPYLCRGDMYFKFIYIARVCSLYYGIKCLCLVGVFSLLCGVRYFGFFVVLGYRSRLCCCEQLYFKIYYPRGEKEGDDDIGI